MLAIANVTAASSAGSERPAHPNVRQRVATDPVPPGVGTALVALARTASPERIPIGTRRPVAAFLAQLIATRQLAPQTRARRRADPAEALVAYRAASDLSAKACAPLQSL